MTMLTRRSKAGLMLAVLVVVAAAVYFFRDGRMDGWLPGEKRATEEQRTAKVEKGDIEVRFREVGLLAPRVQIEVRPPVDGQVKEVFVEEGDAVKRGTRLAIIQPGKTEAEQKLYLPTEVRSPIEGLVLYRTVNPGDGVQAGGEKFMQVANLSTMTVRLEIGEVDILKLKVGQEAQVSVDALPSERFSAKLTFISPGTIQKDSNSYGGGGKKFLVKSDLDRSEPRLRPGMTARIDLLLDKRTGVVKAPLGGVFEEMGRAKAFVKTPSGVEERELTLGLRSEQDAEVLEGLQVGETILLEKPEDAKITKKAVRKAAKR